MRYPGWRSLFLSCILGLTTGSDLLPFSSAIIAVQAAERRSQSLQDGVIQACTGQSIDLGAPQLTNAELTALASCSSEVIPQLLEALKSHDWKVKVTAAHTLGLFGIKAQPAIPALNNLIQDENADVRFVAAQALGEIGVEAVVPALTKALQDKDENVRVSAAAAFQKIGSAAKQAKPVLIDALWDGNWYVRSRAAATISKLGLEESDIPNLLKPWRDRFRPYGALISLMIAIDPHVRERVQDVPAFFIKALQNKDPKVRESAAIALGDIGSTTPGSTQFLDTSNALLKALDDPDIKVRESAVQALGLVLSGFSTGQFESALQLSSYKQGLARVRYKLLGVLLDQSSVIRQSAVESLWVILKLNDDSPQVIAALVTALKDQHPNVRLSAATSLGQWLLHLNDTKISGTSALNSSHEEALKKISSALIDSLYGLDEDVRQEAILALQATESGEKVVLSTLARIIDKHDEKLELRQSAIAMCWILDTLDCESGQLISVLKKALSDPSLAIRQSAAIALVEEKKLDSKTVIKILVEGLRSENPAIRLDAILGIQVLCPSLRRHEFLKNCSDLKAVTPLLLDKLNESIKPLRYAAALAIANIEPGQKIATSVLRELSLEEIDTEIQAHAWSALQGTEFEQISWIEYLTGQDKNARYTRSSFASGSNSWDISDSIEFPLKALKDENLRSLIALSSDTSVISFTEADADDIALDGDPESAAELKAALRKNEKQVTATVSVLISMLNSQNSQQSRSSVLENVFKLKNQDFRRSVAYSLGNIGEELQEGNKYPLVKKRINMALMAVMKDKKDDLDIRWIAATALQKLNVNNVNWFFADNRLANPNNIQCQFSLSKTSDDFITDPGLVFDIYSSQCIYDFGGLGGGGLSQIYDKLRALLNRSKK